MTRKRPYGKTRGIKHKNAMFCENCGNCEYVGEGDYVCMADSRCPVWVKEDWQSTSEYFFCGGKKWREGDGT